MEFLNGVRIGEYKLDVDNVINEIREKCIEGRKNYTAISTYRGEVISDETLVSWAKFCKDNKIYFNFDLGGKIPFSGETAAKIKEAAGEYFIGMFIPELGSVYACSGSGYQGTKRHHSFDNLTEASTSFIDYINSKIGEMNYPDNVGISIVEATSLVSYTVAANTTIPVLETMCGDVENTVPLLRGSAKAKGSDMFINYVAHEWYGGVDNEDVLKMKRLRLAYNYVYMSGSSGVIIESGANCILSHGMKEGYDHEIPKAYRKTLDEFTDYILKDNHPEGYPITKVAFVQGNLDGWSAWNSGSALWNNVHDRDWGYDAPEFTNRILSELGTKRRWSDVHNFGKQDFSGSCGYGTYDIINIAFASAQTLSSYDYLIFTGWNTMTDEIYAKLVSYVKGGGKLFMCACHLNTSDKRNGEIKLINNGDVSELFGCTLDAQNPHISNAGFKFYASQCEDILYPADKGDFDPLLSSGYVNYATVNNKDAKAVALLSNSFLESGNTDGKIAVLENKLGDGYAILLTSLDYPGKGQTYDLYRIIVRELITSSNRTAKVKVLANDRVRYSVYESGDVYLLNTDYDVPSYARVEKDGKVTEITLAPCEIKHIKI